MEQMNRNEAYKLKKVDIRLCLKDDGGLYASEPINSPDQGVKLISEMLKDLEREMVCVVNMDIKGCPINYNIVSIGDTYTSFAPIQNIFKSSILSNASNLMLFHNHPSGDITPSKSDDALTKKVVEAGKLMGIPVIDHIIVGGMNGKRYSYRENYPQLFKRDLDLSTINEIVNSGKQTGKLNVAETVNHAYLADANNTVKTKSELDEAVEAIAKFMLREVDGVGYDVDGEEYEVDDWDYDKDELEKTINEIKNEPITKITFMYLDEITYAGLDLRCVVNLKTGQISRFVDDELYDIDAPCEVKKIPSLFNNMTWDDVYGGVEQEKNTLCYAYEVATGKSCENILNSNDLKTEVENAVKKNEEENGRFLYCKPIHNFKEINNLLSNNYKKNIHDALVNVYGEEFVEKLNEESQTNNKMQQTTIKENL